MRQGRQGTICCGSSTLHSWTLRTQVGTLAAGVLFLACELGERFEPPWVLDPLQPVSRFVDEGCHRYRLDLVAGELIEVEVDEQRGDVRLEFSSPDGGPPLEIDSSVEATTSEPLVWVAEVTGGYALGVCSAVPSRYRIEWLLRRPAKEGDRLSAWAHGAFFRARTLRYEAPEESIAEYAVAAELWRTSGNREREARARYELGIVQQRRDSAAARASYRRAAQLFEALGDRGQEARARHRWGGIESQRRNLDEARRLYRRSLELWLLLAKPHDISVLAFDLARVERRAGRPEEARGLLLEALDHVPGHSTPRLQEAKVRTEMGSLYLYRGEVDRGMREYRTALDILALGPIGALPTELDRQRARTLTRLGSALALAGAPTEEDLEQAESILLQAQALRESLQDERGSALTANSLGLVYERRSRFHEALSVLEYATNTLDDLDRRADLAVVSGNRCRLLQHLGFLGDAQACLLEVVEAYRRYDYQNAEAIALYDLAVNARLRGELPEARAWVSSALQVVELMRSEARTDELRSSFLDRRFEIFELAVDLALELHQLYPSEGHLDAAFRDLETTRGRGLLDLLSHFRGDLTPPPELTRLRSELHDLKLASLLNSSFGADVETLERSLDIALERLRVATPKLSIVTPRILTMSEAMGLVDRGTVALVYHLGEQRSGVWVITESRVEFRTLGAKSAIEATARSLHRSLSGGGHWIQSWDVETLAAELSKQILGPIGDLLDRRRVVVIPSGALHYVPFAVLPKPSSEDSDGVEEPMLIHHQVSYLPSLSVLAALRERGSRRDPAPLRLALVAAPDTVPIRSIRLTSPLPSAEEEAAAILQLAGSEGVRAALGSEANRQFVLGPALREAKVIHFATHGYLDDVRGELSGLTLAPRENGQALDVLLAHELYGLDLRAELVVLSACESALGERIRGEGLVGLSRGFLYAGAQRVLASLWDVDDEATARLMTFFYEGLWEHDLSPVEALGMAQVRMRDEGWRAPYWAAFVVQGDWNPPPLSDSTSRKESISRIP